MEIKETQSITEWKLILKKTYNQGNNAVSNQPNVARELATHYKGSKII